MIYEVKDQRMSLGSVYRLLILVTLLIFIIAIEAQQEPLLFIDDPKDAKRVRLLWNPAYDVETVLELSQQLIKYEKSNGTNELVAKTNGWQTLVTPDFGHSGRNRYVFVKDSFCHEMQFRTSWKNGNGKVFEGIVQKVPPMTIRKNFGAKVALAKIQPQISGAAIGIIFWQFPLNEWPNLDQSDIKLHVFLRGCRTIFNFNRSLEIPTIDEKNTILFEKEFIDHECTFEISLRFPFFDEETACFTIYESTHEESLVVDLNCEDLNLPCAELPEFPEPPEFPCEMSCRPKFLNSSVNFMTVENRTVVFIQYDWQFKKPAVGFLLRHQPIWTLYENRILDFGNASVQLIKETHVELEPFSKVPEAAHGLQIL